DLTTQHISGTATEVLETPVIEDWRDGVLLEATGTLTNNWTKGNPGLVADVLGDWREELLVRAEDSSALRIYLSTEVTDHKLYTLMQDPQYRVGAAAQQTAYNMPQYTGFYLASDMDFADVPVPDLYTPGAFADLRAAFDAHAGDLRLSERVVLSVKLALIERQLEWGKTSQAVRSLEVFVFFAERVDGDAGPVLAYQGRRLRDQRG